MNTLIKRALDSRRIIFQGAIVASLIALGINLTSSWVVSYFIDFPNLVLLVGCLFVVIGFLYFVQVLLSSRHQTMHVDGVIFFDQKDKCVIGVEEYEFSESLDKALRAAFLENEALKSAWEKEMFPKDRKEEKNEETTDDHGSDDSDDVEYFAIVKMEAGEDEHQTESRILIEGVEFCFLEYLSMHLSAYFESGNHESEKITVLERHNIPHVMLSNRILSLLTSPIEDRAIFTKSGINRNPPKDGEIHAIFASNGAVYEKFHLHLPSDTEITRPELGVFVLNHSRFKMEINFKYKKFTKNLPRYFEDLYVSDSIEEIRAHSFEIYLTATLHPSSFLHLNGWEYYRWIDSFFEYFKAKVSFESFLDEINWKSIAARIRAGILKDRRIARAKEEAEAKNQKIEPKDEENG